MTSLSHRLKQIQVHGETAKHDFSHLSLSQLGETTVDFGQTHIGKKYSEMWKHHQDWILWFTGRYEKSGKENHQKFLYYTQLMVERAELEGSKVIVNKGPPMATASMTAKAKPMPKKMMMPVPTDTGSVWDTTEEDFEIFTDELDLGMSAGIPTAQQADVSQLEHRVLSVETTLSQIVALLENLQTPTEPQ